MRHTIHLILLPMALVIGCSKGSGDSSHNIVAPPYTTNLGMVELTAHIPKHFSLGVGRSLTLIGSQHPNCISIKFVVWMTNMENGYQMRSECYIQALPGRQCSNSIGDTMVEFTPTLKAQ